DTTSITYNLLVYDPISVSLGSDSSLFLCQPQAICLDYSILNSQGLSVTEALISPVGTIDTVANNVCFTPTAAGTYEIIVGIADVCGFSRDTILVTVDFGLSAAIDCPADTIPVFLCGPGIVDQLVTVTPASATVSVSYGTYSAGMLSFNADTAGLYAVTMIADESCGSDSCELLFSVDIGQAPQIACPATQQLFTCDAGDSLCIEVGVIGSDSSVTVSPFGIYSGGNVCFPADSSGYYTLEVIATTACGSDTCLVTANVVLNSNPVAFDPAGAIDTFLCGPGQVCYQFEASDVDGGTLVFTKASGDGAVSSDGLFCIDAVTSGSYSITVVVSDSCGLADTTSATIDVTINSAPVATLDPDFSTFICSTQQICAGFAMSDPDGNIAAFSLVTGVGTLTDSSLCFTADTAGVYTFIATVTDDCNETSTDTISVTITSNQAPVANAGSDQTLFACADDPICWPASGTDDDGNLVSCSLAVAPTGATYNGSQICFTPSGTWNYEFVLVATDACGSVSYDTVAIYYTLNQPPVVNAGSDQTLFQCVATEICWPASGSDADGNLASTLLISGPGSFDGSQICFTPPGSGSYTFVLEATDLCGATDIDTVTIDVTVNSAPICGLPADMVISQCVATAVCLPINPSDVDGNLQFCQIVTGPGTISGGSWCYTPTASQVVTVVVRCEDSCGAYCEDQFTVEFKVNRAPQIAFGSQNPLFLCAAQSICLQYSVSDPDDPQARIVTLVSGAGTLDEVNSQVCFTPGSSGSYSFVIEVVDSCGATDRDSIAVDVSLNSPPLAIAGADQTVAQCVPAEICWPASCSDPDANLSGCLLTGPGTYDGSSICFTPTTSGTFEFILSAIDACDAVDEDTVYITVELNDAPIVTLPVDRSITLCDTPLVCIDYTVDDPDGLAGLLESMTSNYGYIDTENNQFCFTPPSSGDYEFIISATDPCGRVGADTITISVTFNEHAAIECPTDTTVVFLCEADSVCRTLNISPLDATVTVSDGVYANGELCVLANATGIYVVEVIAEADCSSDTCYVVFDVEIGEQPPPITCPDPASVFICQLGESVCIPVTVAGNGATISVPPWATYSGGSLCFAADSAGHYEIEFIVSTACGSDTCLVIADITVNTPPVATDPATPVDTALCAAAQICYQFEGTDITDPTLTWSKLSGDGSLTIDGLWCFDALTSGSYTVSVEVADSCGATDTTALTYNVLTNAAPVVDLGDDLVSFVCAESTICIGYIVDDADNNVVLEQLLFGSGTIDTAANEVCFTADTTGLYTLIVGATDDCGAVGADTISITVNLNRPPVAGAGQDNNLFRCNDLAICWPASCTDLDGNLDSCYLVAGDGTYDGSQICFTPTADGVYTFVLRAVDACGESHQDTVNITIDLNEAPVCQSPGDTTVFQCVAEEISLPLSATDADDNFDYCEMISGQGSLIGGNWVYTPTVDQVVSVVFQCLDECGAVCIDSFTVTIDLNDPPTLDAGNDTLVFSCNGGQICLPIASDDPNQNLDSVWIALGSGTYDANSKEFCLNIPFGDGEDRTYTTVLAAIDACSVMTIDTIRIAVDFNAPPTVELPPDFVAYMEEVGELCIPASITDEDGNLAGYSVTPVGVYDPATNEICYNVFDGGVDTIYVTAWDACNDTTYDMV
ncbi:MAG: hypothetical protein V3T31_06275, partial [candidate division Zixibacteria bacterium]